MQDADAAAIVGEAHLRLAAAIEVQARSVGERNVADFAHGGFIAVDAAERMDGDDGGDDEQQHRGGGGDHDVARQAGLLRLRHHQLGRGQADFGGGGFQAIGRIPCQFCLCEGDGVARIRFDPGANCRFFFRRRLAMEPSQQARGFRLDPAPLLA